MSNNQLLEKDSALFDFDKICRQQMSQRLRERVHVFVSNISRLHVKHSSKNALHVCLSVCLSVYQSVCLPARAEQQAKQNPPHSECKGSNPFIFLVSSFFL
jgi:hypothetical protein